MEHLKNTNTEPTVPTNLQPEFRDWILSKSVEDIQAGNLNYPYDNLGAVPNVAETTELLEWGNVPAAAMESLHPEDTTEIVNATSTSTPLWQKAAAVAAATGAVYAAHRGIQGGAIKAQSEHLGHRTAEVTNATKEAGSVAILGLRKAITEKRLKRAQNRLPKVEKTRDVRSEGVNAILEARYPEGKLKPVSRSERKHINKASLRRHRANRRMGDQFLSMKKVYGHENLVSKESMKNELSNNRYSRKEKKAMKGSGKSYRWNDRYIRNRQKLVDDAAKSNNHYGQRPENIKNKISHLDNTVNKLDKKIEDKLASGPGKLKRGSRLIARKVMTPIHGLRENITDIRISNLEGNISRLRTEASFHDNGNDEANVLTGKDMSKKAEKKKAKAYKLSRDLTYAKQQAAERRSKPKY